MTVSARIRAKIEEPPAGEPFVPTVFLALGSRASVDQTLSRLARTGSIERVSRGVYVRPAQSRFVGKVPPAPVKVAKAIAEAYGAIVQRHGAEAARRLELTTQAPTQPVYLTTGSRRSVRLGRLKVEMRKTSPRKLALAGRPAGTA